VRVAAAAAAAAVGCNLLLCGLLKLLVLGRAFLPDRLRLVAACFFYPRASGRMPLYPLFCPPPRGIARVHI
jgi:hypothetical protein